MIPHSHISKHLPDRARRIRTRPDAWHVYRAQSLEAQQLYALRRVERNIATDVRAAKQIGAAA